MAYENRPDKDITDKVLHGEASKEEARLVAKWLATEDGQEYLSSHINDAFSNIHPNYAELYVDHAIPSEKMLATIQRNISRKRNRKIIYQVAAVLLPFIFLLGIFFQLNSRVDLFGKSEYAEVYVPRGERIQMIFQDGTKVYLNSNSRLRYPKQFSFSQRKVSLEGEGYFVVAHEKKRPFIIELDRASIQVLGTSFNVYSYNDEPEICVVLDEGKIDLKSWDKQSNILHPKESLIYNKETGVSTITKQEDARHFSMWKNDTICFKNEPLANVVKILSRWYNVDFEITDSEAYNYSFTMESENTLLEKVLFDLEKVSPLNFIYEDNKVIVKKRDF